MLNKTPKPCKSCNKNPRHSGRTKCIHCIQSEEYEKSKLRAKKEKAYSRFNIRLTGVEEQDREEIREIIKTQIGPFVKSRQIGIKVSRGKVKSELQKLEKKLDDLWSLAVKVNYNNLCAYSGESENLNSHHIESRTHLATRWDIDNGICLTSNHHTFSKVFSAHGTPAKFRAWLIETKGEKFVDNLEKKSRTIYKPTLEDLQVIKKHLEDFITKNS